MPTSVHLFLLVGMKLDCIRKENLFLVLIFPVAMVSAGQCVMQLGTSTYTEAVIMEGFSAVLELCECECRERNDTSLVRPPTDLTVHHRTCAPRFQTTRT